MTYPAVADLEELSGGRVLLRLDLNVPIKDGAVMDATRIMAALPTLQWLLDRADVVAACSHLGKAKGRPDPAYSLKPVAAVLQQELGRPVRFVEDCLDPGRSEAEPGSLLLLENLRFHAGEKANDPVFAGQLAFGFSHYVNDAFGTAHRSHASVVAAAKLFGRRRRAAGFLMARELDSLGRLLMQPEKPYTAVVGGAKISTKAAPLEALLDRVSSLLIGGGMANTFVAQGLEVGRSLVEDEMIDTVRNVTSRAAERGVAIELPTDVVVTDDIEDPEHVDVVPVEEIGADRMVVDLGPASRDRYSRVIADSKTVFWNGPMGVFEVDAFAAGTTAVANALASSKAYSVVGGGESVMAVRRAGLEERIDHVSTGGGASLQFLTGETLPAVAVLEE